jgi:hypothetical protein
MQRKQDPGLLKQAGADRWMGEGLGAGGHATRRTSPVQRSADHSVPIM